MLETILMVCEANMCRSPMAQRIMAHRMPGKRVTSAGVSALCGRPADAAVIRLMREHGYDMTDHVTAALTVDLARSADLILTMTSSQRSRIERALPFTRGKVYRLGEHGAFDVTDPYQMPRAVYEESLAQIEAGIDSWIPGIRKCG